MGQPSVLWKRRSRGGRLSISVNHDDHPGVLAEALDRLAAADWEPAAAAEQLGITTSQLIKLFRLTPESLAIVNQQREVRGLHRLK
jgi:hypothetical protein